MSSSVIGMLQPTLWRTCRALANRRRLRLLWELLRRPDQTVSDLAQRLKFSMPITSAYLRILNARGLIEARRSGRWVSYRIGADKSNPDADALLKAIERTLAVKRKPVDGIFNLVTAFTHPRRLEIVRALRGGCLSARDVRIRTGISRDALCRHLRKLQRRGFLIEKDGRWQCARLREPLAATLLRMACKSGGRGRCPSGKRND